MPDGRGHPCNDIDVHVRGEPALDAEDLGMRDPAQGSQSATTQAGVETSHAKLLAEAAEQRHRAMRRSLGGGLPRWHGATMPVGSLLAVISDFVGSWNLTCDDHRLKPPVFLRLEHADVPNSGWAGLSGRFSHWS
jgi:hypothetical protein